MPHRAVLDVYQGPCPCDECGLRTRCALERLACEAFARFVHRKGWRTAPRAPTSARYVALFAKAKGAPIDGRGGGWHTLTRVVRVSG